MTPEILELLLEFIDARFAEIEARIDDGIGYFDKIRADEIKCELRKLITK
jgi:hypothetical protein